MFTGHSYKYDQMIRWSNVHLYQNLSHAFTKQPPSLCSIFHSSPSSWVVSAFRVRLDGCGPVSIPIIRDDVPWSCLQEQRMYMKCKQIRYLYLENLSYSLALSIQCTILPLKRRKAWWRSSDHKSLPITCHGTTTLKQYAPSLQSLWRFHIPMQDFSKALLAPFWGGSKPKSCLAPYRMMPGNRCSSKPELIFARFRPFRSIWRIPAVDILLLHSGCLACDVDLPSFWNPATKHDYTPLQTFFDSCDILRGLDHMRPQRDPWLSRTILSKAIGVGWGSFTWRPLTPMNWSFNYWDVSQHVALSHPHCLQVSILHALVKSSFCLLLYALIPYNPRLWKVFCILISSGVFLLSHCLHNARAVSVSCPLSFRFSTPMSM